MKNISAPTNNVGSAILALSGMLSSTFKKKPSAKSVKCQIALEKAGVIRPVADRVESGKALTADAYKAFAKLAKDKDETVAAGATKVLDLAKQLAKRADDIAAYKAAQAAG